MYQRKLKMTARLSQTLIGLGGAFWLASVPAYGAQDVNSKTEVRSTFEVQQTGRTVTGTVVDETGEPVIGVNVRVKDTTIGAITDLDGKFSLANVPAGAVLQITYVGYKDQEVVVGSQTDLSIQIQQDTELIDEVVVVGYATQKKVNLTGSVSSINMEDIAEKRPITNLASGLAGMASGVSFRTSSNIPGNESASILIRGQGTLNDSSPLIIVDGVESDIANINPQDVESMSVLKDAASSSIYGSRAANGVILITTKKGKEGKISVDYTGYASLESVGKTVDAVSNYADYMELRNEARVNSGDSPQFAQEVIDAWRNDGGRNPLMYPNTDWVDEVFKNAVATNHNLSLSGGTDKLSFYTSFGYSNNPGIMENSGYERYSFRSNVEAKPTKWLTLGMKLNGYLANNDIGSDWVDDLFTYGYASTPGIVLRAPDGRFGGAQAEGEDIQTNNPLQQLYSRTGNKKNRNLRAVFNGTITPLEGLSISGSYSYELTDKDNWEKPNQMALWNFATDQEVRQTYTGKTYIYNYNRKIERMFMDAVVRYNNKFVDDKLDLGVMVGASQEMRRDRSFSATKYDWIDSSVDVINGATGDATASGSHTEWAMRSYFGRINLGWADRYLFEANLRADGSSRFLKGNRWGWFPSFSAGWRIDQEAFMESSRDWLDALKLRLSWGELGNNYLSSDYQAISKYAATNYSFGGQMQTGMTITSLANGALTWESTAVTNAAVDFTVLNNRLSGTAEYFYKKTSDILIDLPAPLVHGNASIPTQNSAEVTNRGFELTLNWADHINDFHYNIGTNFTFVDNKVTKFKGDEPSIDGSTMILEGYPINVQYCLVVDRIIQSQEDLDYVQSLIDNAPVGEDGKKVDPFQTYTRPEMGDVLYKDMDGNGIFNDDDRVPMGHGDTPRFFYDINLGCSWKGLDFSMLMSGTGNYKVQYQSMHTTNMPASGYQIGQEIADGRWYEGRTTPAKYPRLLSNDGRNTRNSTLWLTNRKFLKIRNIQLGYTLPQKWVQAASLSRVRVFCSLENFFTFSDFVGMDPENTNNLAYPNIRQASFGLNVSF